MATYAANLTVPVGESVDRYLSDQPNLVVVPNMGNAGDSLINYSMYSLLDKRKIPYTIVEAKHIQTPDPKTTYLLMVNGGLHLGGDEMDRLVQRMSRHGSKMIFHSATIHDRDRLLAMLPASTVIIAREPVTFEYIRWRRSDITTVLSEDATMAIADGDADYPNPPLSLRLEYRVRLLYQTLRQGFPTSFALAPQHYRSGRNEVFDALRLDNESAGKPVAPGNVDLSIVCGGKQAPGHAEASAAMLLQIVKSKPIVRTDRLHVAISCCLMNVECWFSANSYFKCEAIYKHSLGRRFANIKWVPPTSPVPSKV
jgi:hypothetical protein